MRKFLKELYEDFYPVIYMFCFILVFKLFELILSFIDKLGK